MIKTVTVKNDYYDDLVIELRSPEKSGFFINKMDGLGPARSIINTTEFLYGPGGFFNSSRIGQRNVVISLGFYDGGEKSVEELRIKSYKHFAMSIPITIEIETDIRTVTLSGRVETNEPFIFSKDAGSQISLVCTDPFVYSKDSVATLFSGTLGLFEFPFENPSTTEPLIQFGSIVTNTEGNVFYEGDVPTGFTMVLKFTGSASSVAVHNLSTGESMAIDSAKLVVIAGGGLTTNDTIVITTHRTNKRIVLIRNGVEINIANALDVTSKWLTLQRNDNVIAFTAGSGLGNIQFTTFHNLVYEGV